MSEHFILESLARLGEVFVTRYPQNPHVAQEDHDRDWAAAERLIRRGKARRVKAKSNAERLTLALPKRRMP